MGRHGTRLQCNGAELGGGQRDSRLPDAAGDPSFTETLRRAGAAYFRQAGVEAEHRPSVRPSDLMGWVGSNGMSFVRALRMEPPFRELDVDDRSSDWLVFSVVAAGVVLRLFHYLYCRSMWFDEACLTLNIVHRGFAELATPLGFHQAAPIGFLWLERAAVFVLGDGELALRFLPTVSGIASLLLFTRIVRSVISPKGALISILLFGLSWPLVRYATEVKPYAVDALVGVAVWWMVLQVERRRFDILRAAAFGIFGGVLVWCSFPAVFVLAGAGLALGLRAVLMRDRKALISTLIAGGTWAVSGLLLYLTALRALEGDAYFAEFWRATFMPVPPWSTEWILWMLHAGGAVLRSTLGLPLSIAGVVAGAVGVGSLVTRRPLAATFLVSPILLALVASACGRYPFAGRFLLFSAPACFAMMGEGTAWFLRPHRFRGVTWVGWVVVGALVVQTLALSVEHIVRPGAPQEIKPALVQLREHSAADDLLIVDRVLLCPYQYYRKRFELTDCRTQVVTPSASDGRTSDVVAEAVAAKPITGRLWLLLSDLGHLDPADVGSRLDVGAGRVFECSQVVRVQGVVLLRCVRDFEAGPVSKTGSDKPK